MRFELVQAVVLLSFVHVEILQPLCFLLMIDRRVLNLSVLFILLHSAALCDDDSVYVSAFASLEQGSSVRIC